jgi:hypothetical protein
LFLMRSMSISCVVRTTIKRTLTKRERQSSIEISINSLTVSQRPATFQCQEFLCSRFVSQSNAFHVIGQITTTEWSRSNPLHTACKRCFDWGCLFWLNHNLSYREEQSFRSKVKWTRGRCWPRLRGSIDSFQSWNVQLTAFCAWFISEDMSMPLNRKYCVNTGLGSEKTRFLSYHQSSEH